MYFATVTLTIACLLSAVSAHFQLSFPSPRGAFDEDTEPRFCGGYTNVTTTRTAFPLGAVGFYSILSEHPEWTIGVFLSTVANPNSFENFTQIVPFQKLSGEGDYCLPLDVTTLNGTRLADKTNATIQIVYDGGDSQLYQCADLTLDAAAVIAADVKCSNATGINTGRPGANAGTPKDNGSSQSHIVSGAMVAAALALVGSILM